MQHPRVKRILGISLVELVWSPVLIKIGKIMTGTPLIKLSDLIWFFINEISPDSSRAFSFRLFLIILVSLIIKWYFFNCFYIFKFIFRFVWHQIRDWFTFFVWRMGCTWYILLLLVVYSILIILSNVKRI